LFFIRDLLRVDGNYKSSAIGKMLRYVGHMEAAEVLEICREAIYVLIVVSAPLMLVALFVGLIIALFQALTQIQEATLTFVPKILAMLLMLIVMMPFMLSTLSDFANKLQDKIAHIE
jgi:flagellar biosynthetic protein FliQ